MPRRARPPVVVCERRVVTLEERHRERRLLARVAVATDRGVLLGQLLVEPAVRRTLGFRPGDGLLEERDRLVGAAEPPEGLADRVARDLDRAGVRGIALARPERALERVERGLEIAGLVVLPAEVVEERPEPVRGVVVELGELDSSLRPVEEVVAIRGDERDHVCRVGRDEVLTRLERKCERGLEERPSRQRIAAERRSRPRSRSTRVATSRVRAAQGSPPRREALLLHRSRRAARTRARAA